MKESPGLFVGPGDSCFWGCLGLVGWVVLLGEFLCCDEGCSKFCGFCNFAAGAVFVSDDMSGCFGGAGVEFAAVVGDPLYQF